jgi:hypothetical protein
MFGRLERLDDIAFCWVSASSMEHPGAQRTVQRIDARAAELPYATGDSAVA